MKKHIILLLLGIVLISSTVYANGMIAVVRALKEKFTAESPEEQETSANTKYRNESSEPRTQSPERAGGQASRQAEQEEAEETEGRTKISFVSFWTETRYNNLVFSKATSFNTLMQTIINRVNTRKKLGYLDVNQHINLTKGYYHQLDTILQDEEKRPDMYLISSANLGKYYINGFVEELYHDDLSHVDIDITDWTNGIIDLISVEDHIYGIPIGQDLLVWYVNIDVFREAGLLDKKGRPILPSSYEEMVQHANQVQGKTGKPYMGVDFLGYNATRMMLSLMWQFGVDILESTPNGREVVFESFSSRLVGTDMQNFFFEANNYTQQGRSTVKLQQDFIDGKFAVLVDTLSAKEVLYQRFKERFDEEHAFLQQQKDTIENSDNLKAINDEIIVPNTRDYAYISSFPKIYKNKDKPQRYSTVWGITNLIVIRRGLRKENYAKYLSSLDVLKKINESDLEWSKRGLTPILYSSLEEDIYSNVHDNQEGIALVEKSEYVLLENKDIFRQLNLRDIPLSDNYQDSMIVLQAMTNDIIVRRIRVKDSLAEASAKLLDIMIKGGTVIYD